MHIGFTGTRAGMTTPQGFHLIKELEAIEGEIIVHHGDCIGSDAEFHGWAKKKGHFVVLHPPSDQRHRAFCRADRDEIRPAMPYIERNHAIVHDTEILFATPVSTSEFQRFGIWATIRYARKLGRKIIIVFPNGNVEVENG